jgi:hypothetical protein
MRHLWHGSLIGDDSPIGIANLTLYASTRIKFRLPMSYGQRSRSGCNVLHTASCITYAGRPKGFCAAERCSRPSTPVIGYRLTQPLKSTTISFSAPGPEPSPGFDISRGHGRGYQRRFCLERHRWETSVAHDFASVVCIEPLRVVR